MNFGKNGRHGNMKDVVACSITNGNQKKALFLHPTGKEVKGIYGLLNSDHTVEMLTLRQRTT